MPLRSVEDLTPEECEILMAAAVVGVASLALELERMGYSTTSEALDDARGLRWMILDAAQAPDSKARAAEEELERRRREARGE